MSNHSPIPSPPPELMEQWEQQFLERPTINGCFVQSYIATQAAQWGADQELEACCEWIPKYLQWDVDQLRASRRPKPPSLKEQALAALEVIPKLVGFESERDAICRALEALDD